MYVYVILPSEQPIVDIELVNKNMENVKIFLLKPFLKLPSHYFPYIRSSMFSYNQSNKKNS